MRIISGSARGRRLKTPEGLEVRPTTDRIKESVFNIIQFGVEGRRALDLYAGCGQMGLEALSRGAAFVRFVDARAVSVRIIKENLETLGFSDKAGVTASDCKQYLRTTAEKFDLIFVDPPYGGKLAQKTTLLIAEFDILTSGGIIVCETGAGEPLPELPEPYMLGRSYKYGKTLITIYKRS